MLSACFLEGKLFILVFSILNAFCIWEFMSFSPFTAKQIKWVGTIFTTSVLSTLFINQASVTPFWLYTYFGFTILFQIYLLYELFFSERVYIHLQNPLFIGLFYITLPFMSLYFIQQSFENYGLMVLGILLMIWSNDSFAYFVGKKFGKTPFFKRISPKKTWEGTIGGAAITILCAPVLTYIVGAESFGFWMISALIVSIFGSVGDLVESMFKRNSEVKDSSNFLPGHGGFLDRLDSFIFVLPIITLFWILIKFN